MCFYVCLCLCTTRSSPCAIYIGFLLSHNYESPYGLLSSPAKVNTEFNVASTFLWTSWFQSSFNLRTWKNYVLLLPFNVKRFNCHLWALCATLIEKYITSYCLTLKIFSIVWVLSSNQILTFEEFISCKSKLTVSFEGEKSSLGSLNRLIPQLQPRWQRTYTDISQQNCKYSSSHLFTHLFQFISAARNDLMPDLVNGFLFYNIRNYLLVNVFRKAYLDRYEICCRAYRFWATLWVHFPKDHIRTNFLKCWEFKYKVSVEPSKPFCGMSWWTKALALVTTWPSKAQPNPR